MCILDMSYHLYFKAFLPTVQTYSYVHNLAVQVYTAGELLRAWIAYLAFCDMWQIEPDTEKSLAWSLDPKMTQQAQLIGPHVVTEMKDLGGHMTFKTKQTSRPTTTKTQSIDWEWRGFAVHPHHTTRRSTLSSSNSGRPSSTVPPSARSRTKQFTNYEHRRQKPFKHSERALMPFFGSASAPICWQIRVTSDYKW